jgi:hypothetical protein
MITTWHMDRKFNRSLVLPSLNYPDTALDSWCAEGEYTYFPDSLKLEELGLNRVTARER